MRFVCLIGLLRMIYELCLVYFIESGSVFVMADVLLLFAFLFGFVMTFYPIPIEWVTIPVSLIVISLLSFSWVNMGGIEGVGEYNFLALVALIGLIHTGRSMYVFIIVVLFMELLLLWLWNYQYALIEFLIEKKHTTDAIQYVSIASAFTLSLLYLMYQYDRNRFKLSNQKIALSVTIQEVKAETRLILERKEELRQVNADLDKKILYRKKQLNQRSAALRKVLTLTLDEFNPPLAKLNNALKRAQIDNEKNPVMKMMNSAMDEIQSEYNEMVEEMKKIDANNS